MSNLISHELKSFPFLLMEIFLLIAYLIAVNAYNSQPPYLTFKADDIGSYLLKIPFTSMPFFLLLIHFLPVSQYTSHTRWQVSNHGAHYDMHDSFWANIKEKRRKKGDNREPLWIFLG
jgi:hypothetical protein